MYTPRSRENGRTDTRTRLFVVAMALVMVTSIVAPIATAGEADAKQEVTAIDGTVVDADGEPVEGADVMVDGEETLKTVTEADGTFEIAVDPGSYTVWASHDEDASEDVSVTVDEGETETLELELLGEDEPPEEEVGTVVGTVTDEEDEPIEGASVIAESGDDMVFDETDAEGEYELALAPGTYTLSAYAEDPQGVSDEVSVDVEADATETIDLMIETVEDDPGSDYVVDASVEHVGGTEPDEMPEVDAVDAAEGQINVDLVDTEQDTWRQEIADLGVDETTEFEITVEFADFTPRAAVAVGEDVEWERDDSTMTITTRPLETQWIEDSPTFDDWPEGDDDRADVAFDAMVSVLVLELDFPEDDFDPTDHPMEGMTIATDAQAFSAPQYEPGEEGEPDELNIWIAGPHLTVDGEENEGIYQALLPDGLLEEWGVEDADEIDAAYKGESTDFSATERDDGILIELDVSYSAGEVSISPDVTPEIKDYVDDDGVVRTTGLVEAIDDWRAGEAGTDLLIDVIDAWRSDEPIE